MNVKNFTRLQKLILIAVMYLMVLGTSVFAQNGYIYVHNKTLNEESSSAFTFNGSGTIGSFTLNDVPGFLGVVDIGASSNGRLWAIAASGGRPSQGAIYYRDQGSSTWTLLAGSPNDVTNIDGGPSNTAIYRRVNGDIYFYTGSAHASQLASGYDVAYDRPNDRLMYIGANNIVYYKPAFSGSWTAIPNIRANQIDGMPSGLLLLVGTDNNIYTSTFGGSATGLGQPAGVTTATDVGVGSNGAIFSTYYSNSTGEYNVYRWTGTDWVMETGGRFLNRITGGPGGQIWGQTVNSPGQSNPRTIWARTNTGDWINDERVRTSSVDNSRIIQLPAGTYTVTETVPANWALQNITVYDSTNNTTVNLGTATANVDLSAGEVVHLIFSNALIQTTAAVNDCGSFSFNENFGTGTAGVNEGPALTGLTDYHWVGSSGVGIGAVDRTVDGYYAVVSRAADAGFGAPASDHTVDVSGDGRFLLVNANYEANTFYQRRITGLIPGVQYTLSYWVADVSPSAPLRPNILVTVSNPANDSILGSSNTGNITTGAVWVNKTFTFSATQSIVDLRLKNNGIGGIGNDLGIDDITFKVATTPAPVTTVTGVTCTTGGTITVTSPVDTIYEYNINGGSFQPGVTFPNLNPGSYTVAARYKNSVNCNSTKIDTLNPVICGNVYDDFDGMTDGVVDGPGTNVHDSVYVNLVNPVTNQVIASILVNSDGSYQLPAVASTNYNVILSNSFRPVGSALTTASLPPGWVVTGEGLVAGGDGTPNGIVSVSVITINVNNVNFGIEQLPTANPATSPSQQNPGGTGRVTVPTLTGSDPEQGSYPGIGNQDTIIINTLPTNGILYYNGVAVVAGDTIKNYNPALLTVNPNDSITAITFTFSEVDAARRSSAPALVTMPFTTPAAFVCENIMYEVYGSLTTSTLGKIEVNTGATQIIAAYAVQTNAIAYNAYDNMIWGVQNGTQLVRIDAAGTVQNMSVSNLSLSGSPAIGAISPDGYYYVSSTTSFTSYYVVDVRPSRATYLQLVDRVTFAPLTSSPYSFTATYTAPVTGVGIGDWAWNAADGMLWGVAHQALGVTPVNQARLFKMDPATGVAIVDVPVLNPSLGATGTLGSVVIDVTGYLYSKQNSSGKIYKINMGTGTYTELSTSNIVSANDGTVCPTATLNLLVTGNVFHDVNGLTDNTVNGLGTNTGTTLYAVMYDNTTGQVIDSAVVRPDGTFVLNANLGNQATIYLTTTPVTIHQASVPTITLPAGWVTTGENLGAGSGDDNMPNSVLPLGVVNMSINNANFGIERPPLANTATAPPQVNPGGTVSVPVSPALFGGTDPDGNIDSIVITTFPTNAASIIINGITYTSATFPPGGVSVPADDSGQPAQPISVDPLDSIVTVSIPYLTVDNAGVRSALPGNVNVPFVSAVMAVDDSSLDNIPETPVTLNILTNDTLSSDVGATPGAVTVDLDPSTPGNQSTLTVTGQGTWTYNSGTGTVTFTPDPGFTTNPTPIPYILMDTQSGLTDTAIITITYLPPLPVKLLSFVADVDACKAQLVWKTASEVNAYKFYIEHSNDGRSYNRIGSLPAKGSASSITAYKYALDMQTGVANYYRLAMVDMDGKTEYSPVINLKCQTGAEIYVYPNPASAVGGVYIRGLENGMVVELLDLSGKKVLTQITDADILLLKTGALVKGTYFVHVTRNGQLVNTTKLSLH